MRVIWRIMTCEHAHFCSCSQVHVLRQLRGHEHIVKLCDVVEMSDALYVVMERIEGPDLAGAISPHLT